jgi:hypothetical protein
MRKLTRPSLTEPARKLQAFADRKLPKFAYDPEISLRFAEMCWFVQQQSFQPGGLDLYVRALLEACPNK